MTRQQSAAPSTDPAEIGAPAAVPDLAAARSPAGIARRAYAVGVHLLALAVVTQFLLAGLGIFFDPRFLSLWHATVGASVIAGLALLLVAIGRVGRVPGRTLWLTAAVFGLVVMQSLLLAPYHMDAGGPLRAVAGLHVVNALLIFWVVLRLLERAHSPHVDSASLRSTPR
jgi:hypothetical protein